MKQFSPRFKMSDRKIIISKTDLFAPSLARYTYIFTLFYWMKINLDRQAKFQQNKEIHDKKHIVIN